MAGGQIPARYRGDFIGAGLAYSIPPEVLAGVADVESGFNATIRSSAGAIGFMQIMPGTARTLGVNPLNVRESIWGAAKYLHELGYSKDPVTALAKYNAGPNAQPGVLARAKTGYAQTVLAQARRLAPDLGGAAATRPASTSGGSAGGGHGFWDDLLKGLVYFAFVAGGGVLTFEGARRLVSPVRAKAGASS